MSYTADTVMYTAGGQNMLRFLFSICCNKVDMQSDCNSCTCIGYMTGLIASANCMEASQRFLL